MLDIYCFKGTPRGDWFCGSCSRSTSEPLSANFYERCGRQQSFILWRNTVFRPLPYIMGDGCQLLLLRAFTFFQIHLVLFRHRNCAKRTMSDMAGNTVSVWRNIMFQKYCHQSNLRHDLPGSLKSLWHHISERLDVHVTQTWLAGQSHTTSSQLPIWQNILCTVQQTVIHQPHHHR